MFRRRSILVAPFCLLVFGGPTSAAVRGDEGMYVGGTMSDIPDRTEGKLDLTSTAEATFESKKGRFSFAYSKINSLEYGQKAGRRVGVAIVITVWALFSKKRKHFLTIGFDDAQGNPQGVVLEIAKGRAKTFITVIEARSGKKVEYESADARNHVHG